MWSVREGRALWESKLLQAVVDLSRPARGLHDVVFNARPLPATQLLQMQLETRLNGPGPRLVEAIHRASDLTAIYAETEGQPIRTQLQWRVSESMEPLRVVVDFIVSAETSQLDSDPRIRVSSTVGGGPWRQLRKAGAEHQFAGLDDTVELSGCSAGVHVVPIANAGVQYAQLLLPSDETSVIHSHRQSNGTCTLHTVMFRERLEKGVIRRVRIRGVMSECELDVRLAAQWAEQLRAAALPLSEAS